MAKSFTITFESKKLNRQIQKAIRENPKAAVQAMQDCVLDLSAQSAKRAPIETGDLRSNCHGTVQGETVFLERKKTASPIAPALRVNGVVGYSLPYALRQHEELTFKHPKGGEAKFLERPFRENSARYVQRFQRIVKDVIE